MGGPSACRSGCRSKASGLNHAQNLAFGSPPLGSAQWEIGVRSLFVFMTFSLPAKENLKTKRDLTPFSLACARRRPYGPSLRQPSLVFRARFGAAEEAEARRVIRSLRRRGYVPKAMGAFVSFGTTPPSETLREEDSQPQGTSDFASARSSARQKERITSPFRLRRTGRNNERPFCLSLGR